MEVLHSSPADYIMNSQVFDDMITQMLANLGDSGPPPAEQKKIDQLPTVLSTPGNMESCTLLISIIYTVEPLYNVPSIERPTSL